MRKFNNVMVMAAVKGQVFKMKLTEKLHEQRGDFAADKGVVIAITVALGGIGLVLASTLLKSTIATTLTSKISEFFNFS